MHGASNRWLIVGVSAIGALVATMLIAAAVASIWLDDLPTEFVVGTALGLGVASVIVTAAAPWAQREGRHPDQAGAATFGEPGTSKTGVRLDHNVFGSNIVSRGGPAIGVNDKGK